MSDRIRVYVVSIPGRKYLALRWKDESGKWCQESSGSTRTRDAERKAGEKEEELNQQLRSRRSDADGSLEWSDFHTLYTEEKFPGLKGESRKKINGTLAYLCNHERLKTIGDLDRNLVSELVQLWRRNGLAETTIKVHLVNIGGMLRWAKTARYIAEVPELPSIRGFQADFHGKGRPIRDEEYEAMRQVTPSVVGEEHGRAWLTALEGLWLSGMRIDELVRASWDPNDPIAIIFDAKNRPQLQIKARADKSGKARVCPLTPDYARHLEQLPRSSKRVYDFPSSRGGIRNTDSIGEVISQIGKTAGIKVSEGKYASAHDLRRSFGTRWASKVAPKILQELMRHKTISTTMRFYAHLEAENVQDQIWGTA